MAPKAGQSGQPGTPTGAAAEGERWGSALRPTPSLARESRERAKNVKRKSAKALEEQRFASRLPKTSPSSTNDPLPDVKKVKFLKEIAAPHVDAFNFAVGDGLRYALNDILPKTAEFDGGRRTRIWLEDVRLHKPMRADGTGPVGTLQYPAECRELHTSYGARMTATVCFDTPSGVERISRLLGTVPVMVGSTLCNLCESSPRDMVRRKEDATEFGGYFICNGIERVVRMLQIPRRNHIMAIVRSAFENRGRIFTDKAVTMRCVGPDQTGMSVSLHYLRDGTAKVRVGIRKAEYFIPVMLLLKALKAPMASDQEIYTSVLRGAHLDGDTFISDRVELSLRQVADLQLFTSEQCITYLGSQFRNILQDCSSDMSNEDAGRVFLRKHIFVHLNNHSVDQVPAGSTGSAQARLRGAMSDEQVNLEKFNLLVEMLRKLYAFVSGRVGADDADALSNHELLLGGHLYGSILKERLDMYLVGLRAGLLREYNLARKLTDREAAANGDPKILRKVLERSADVGKKLFYFLATGNVVSESGLDLMQTAGFTVVAEKLNRYRFLSHFRAVHRGQFFTTMKTTAVRKLLPESWGFLCPVHTPDGTPCGLLNHLASMCTVVTHHPRGGESLAGYSEAAIAAAAAGGDTSAVKKKRKKKSRSLGSGTSTAASLTPTLVSAQSASSLLSALAQLIKTLIEWGVTPAGPRAAGIVPPFYFLPVMVDGRVVGHAPGDLLAKTVVPRLRRAKAHALRVDAAELKGRQHYFQTARALQDLMNDPHGHYSATMEVCFVPESSRGGAFPGLYLFTGAGRMVRPVVHLESGLVELVGPMAQTFLEVAVRPEEVRLGTDTHCEIWPTSMLSLIASLTPFSDFNQSPRNMYQCQMGKQTMGTPVHNLRFRTDNKLYRIQTPQAPLVQNVAQEVFSMDEYPNGTNAIVAVISYTGYDMEDAMILNKSSYERGFAHASVYKTKTINLTDSKQTENMVFSNVHPPGHPKAGTLISPALGLDGLPRIGDKIRAGTPIAAMVDQETGTVRIEKHKDAEPCIVDQVRCVGFPTGKFHSAVRQVCITFRYNRNPVVGDKFSSRHGQKGVLSILWPQEDMPFTESGMTPDVIINPHAFPSRMTIGMLIESMAGKAGALHGVYQDSTPFTMQGDREGETAVDYFGDQLRAAGYNYYGSEPLYSGLQGTELKADIYIGVVYYQRLRHMVSDKSQVRSLGPIDPVTRQPVQGRKRMGGVRFGEMERDSLLAHGTSFLMRDRLLNCSDRHIAYVCCGSILGVHKAREAAASGTDAGSTDARDALGVGAHSAMERRRLEQGFLDTSAVAEDAEKDHLELRERARFSCRICGRSDRWYAMTVPYVLRYLVNELAAMGVKISIS